MHLVLQLNLASGELKECKPSSPLFGHLYSLISGGFSRLGKVQFVRFFGGYTECSHTQIFRHCLFCSSTENPSV